MKQHRLVLAMVLLGAAFGWWWLARTPSRDGGLGEAPPTAVTNNDQPDSAVSGAEPTPRSGPVAIGSIRAMFVAGRFAAARDALRASMQGNGAESADARRDLPFLEAVAWGSFDAALEALRALHRSDGDFVSAAHVARLLALRGERDAALHQALVAVTSTTSTASISDRVQLLECVLAGAPAGAAADQAAHALIELDRWNAVARSVRFRSAVLHSDFAAARAGWRELYCADLLGEELYSTEVAATELLFEAAATEPSARWRLGRALADRRRWVEAAHCLRDAADPTSVECFARAKQFVVFTQELDRVWVAALAAGLADGKFKSVVDAAVRQLCELLGATSAMELYRKLRDDYGLYLLLLSSEVTSSSSEAVEILTLAPRQAPVTMRLGPVRRVVTGAPTFRMAWVLSPLTAGTGAKDLFRPDWPDTIVLHASYSIAVAAEACAVALGTSRDPSSQLPLMADLSTAPGQVASAYMLGNQGNLCLQRMRAGIASELAVRTEVLPEGSAAWRSAFVGSLAMADLWGCEVHEMQHVADHRDGVADRSSREGRAFLAELELAPAAARYLRLAIIATGGNAAAIGDPYEAANMDLLVGFLRALIDDKEIAPQIDRTRNLQAQLHLLEADEIAEIARRVARARGKRPQ